MLNVEYVDIDSIRPYENNAKQHPQEQIEQIKKSILTMGDGDPEKGFKDPIGVWNDEIVEGHGRHIAAKELGMKKVPIIRLDDLTDAQRKAYALIHNKLTMNSDFDFETLEMELADLETEFDMSDFGFFDEAVEELPPAEEDDYEPEPPEEPKTKPGDIYQLGRHRLMCGDSTIITDVEKLCNGREIDLLLTDPPYNVALGMGGSVDEARLRHRRTDGLVIMNDKMENDDFRKFLTDCFSNAKMVMKAGACFYIWHADNEGYNFRGAVMDAGFELRQTLIWVKNIFTFGRQDYQWQHEPCLYGWKEGAGHNWYSDRKQSTVLEYDKPSKSELHPTMKPLPLFDYQIRNSSKKGDAVLDLFGGSGTTMICCEENGRDAYLMELDPRYCDVIVNRWETLTGKKAVLLNDSRSDG